MVSFNCPTVLDAVDTIERILAAQDDGAVEDVVVYFTYEYGNQGNWEFSKTELEGLARVGAVLAVTCYHEAPHEERVQPEA